MMNYVDVLRPFLESAGPTDEGEWGMFCPLHDDNKRSASVNFVKGTFYCHACDKGMTVPKLAKIVQERETKDEEDDAPKKAQPQALPSEAMVKGWCAALKTNEAYEELILKRGVTDEIIDEYQLGWDTATSAYTIPIYGPDGELVNIRRYQLEPTDGRRKIWSIAGHGTPTLYPFSSLDNSGSILICEGEFDTLLTLQNGFRAITRTGAADVWHKEWSEHFEGKTVYICHDADDKGQKANFKIARALVGIASEIYIVPLPYEITDKHGKDLTDYWLDGHTPEEFEELLNELTPWKPTKYSEHDPKPLETVDLRVIDTLSAAHPDRQVRVRATVTGRNTETYTLPESISLTCDMNFTKCEFCPMGLKGWAGHHEHYIPPDDVDILAMMDSSTEQTLDIIRRRVNVPKCPKFQVDIGSYHPVEVFYIRPDVDAIRMSYDTGDYQGRKVISCGNHDTLPNTTVELTGRIHPHHRSQGNTYLVSDVAKTKASIDAFEVTSEIIDRLSVFQDKGGSPLRKCVEIARDMAANVTGIYGRVEMHVLMDLAFHSIIGFEYDGKMERRGWLDVLILGDTRTGKSEGASRLLDYYRAGEMVSCEAASFAGVVGGLSQHAGREWVVQWGAIPLNDRRAVVLDEISGLHHEEIASMSSIRSSGVAELTKIRKERTLARTRLIWMGNPRNADMSRYTYGVQGIKPLIGNPEDIARFDLAMTLTSGDVTSEDINTERLSEGSAYSSQDCHDLIMWCWSRQPHQVFWQVGAQDLTRQLAVELGSTYIEQPPLIQAASVRVKVARIAVAIAARTFNTDDGETLLVGMRHVEAAFQLINKIYSMPNFGYRELSEDAMAEDEIAKQNHDEMLNMLRADRELGKFLRNCMGGFRSEDLSDVLSGVGMSDVNAIAQKLYALRMVTKNGKELRITSTLREILREDRRT